MADLETRIFIGIDKDDATAQLSAAIAGGSFPVLSVVQSAPLMWITHLPLLHGGYELHVTAWVKVDGDLVQEEIEAIHEEPQ